MYKEMDIIGHVVAYLKEKINPERESVELEYPFIGGSRYYRSDIYLPKGCAALKIAPKTIIEIKSQLGADTLYYLSQMYIENKELWNVNGFIVIYGQRGGLSLSFLLHYEKYKEDPSFKVFWVTNFCKDASKHSLKPKVDIEKWEVKRNRLLEDAHQTFLQGHNTLFLGAGLGADPKVKMPMWSTLLGDLLHEAQVSSHSSIGRADYEDIDSSCDHSSLIIGRYIENGFKNFDQFTQKMHDSLYQNNPRPISNLYKEIVNIVATHKVDQVITFNYDDLVETALEDKGYSVHSIYDRSHYSGMALPVYHVHGMIPQTREIASTPVLSEKEYHTLYKESFHWSNVVQLYALSRTTCFFIGLSMNDPNLRRLLDIARNGMDLGMPKDSLTDRPCHFVFLERKPLNDKSPQEEKDREHFVMQEKMMEDLGINVIWFERGMFSEIPHMLKYIRIGK